MVLASVASVQPTLVPGNPQTGLLNPGGYTTRFGPATPQNNSQDILGY